MLLNQSARKELNPEKFKRFCYDLYKLDWVNGHVSIELQLDTRVKWFNEDGETPFEQWVEEHGYEGQIYVGYAEFLDTEFLSPEYMEYLLYCDDTLLDIWEAIVG